MSFSKEAQKLALIEAGLPEWQAEMIAAEADLGGMAGAIADARGGDVHRARGMLPEREPTARERAQTEAQIRAKAEQEAAWEADRDRARATRDEWNQKRNRAG